MLSAGLPAHRFWLNGIEVRGYGLRVSGGLPIKTEEIEGDSSDTEIAEVGTAAKRLQVTLSIRHRDSADLAELRAMCEAVDDAGSRIQYTIQHPLALAFGITAAQFSDELMVVSIDGKRAWMVSFELRERGSIAEKNESKGSEKAPSAESKPAKAGDKIGAGSTSTKNGKSSSNSDSKPAPQSDVKSGKEPADLKPEGTLETTLAKIESLLSDEGEE